jgi:hypothetical protein
MNLPIALASDSQAWESHCRKLLDRSQWIGLCCGVSGVKGPFRTQCEISASLLSIVEGQNG